MKKMFLAAMLAVMGFGIAFAGPIGPVDATRSREFSSSTIPVDGYVLVTDGKWNKWKVMTDAITAGMLLPAVNGMNITNISAANIAPGTVASAFSGLAITNISAANLKPGTVISAVSGAAITNIPAVAFQTAVQTSLGKADSALQPNTVVVTGATNGVVTAAITVTNGLGAASTVIGIWSATSNGAATDVNLISLVATTGTLLSQTNSGTIVIATDATGYAALTATVSAASTNHVAFIQNNGVRRSSAKITFDGP